MVCLLFLLIVAVAQITIATSEAGPTRMPRDSITHLKIDISENLCYNILRAFIQARERRA